VSRRNLSAHAATLGIEGLGALTPKASSLLVMAIFGGAVIPQLQGVLAERIGVPPTSPGMRCRGRGRRIDLRA
jgi:fucose permease